MPGMDDTHQDAASWRNFYGRRRGKRLRDSQRTYLSEDLAALSPGPVGRDENPDRAPLDLSRRFGRRPLWLEIGFGGGEHMVHQAARNPQVAILGCEPFINGVAMLLGKIRAARLDNVGDPSGRRARSLRRAASRPRSTGRSALSRTPGRRRATTGDVS